VLQVDDLASSVASSPSTATTESRLLIRRNLENEIASFRGSQPRELAISKPPSLEI
jgi:hypothetical protein